MTPLIILGFYFPVITVVFLIIALIRLIVRLSNKGNSSQTYKPPYTPPPQNPGQYGNQNPANNPYTNPPPPGMPQQPWQNPGQNPVQNPGTYQQPNYTNTPNTPPTYIPPDFKQPNYQQPDYTQGNFQQPDYSQGTYQQLGAPKRSTNIGAYATQIPEAPKKSRAGLIAGIIIGVVVLVIGSVIAIVVTKKNGGGGLTSSSFHLGYENPTDNTYYLILDEWDTIKVDPHTSSDNLDYTFRKDLKQFHWQMTTEDGKVIADTSLSRSDVEEWDSNRSAYTYINSLIIFNPSRTEFVYYTAWYDEEGTDYMDYFKVGDSTFYADAYVVNDAFIFDQRDPEYITALSDAKTHSTEEQNQFLVNAGDFAVLYKKLNSSSSQNDLFENYRNELLDLFTYAREEVMANNAYDADDVIILYDLDSMTPGPVDEYTTPNDFVSSIEFVKDHARLFKATAPDQYNYIIDSADVLLKHSYTVIARDENQYPEMKFISYSVFRDGLFDDEPRRETLYSYDRDLETGGISY
jgi:hypothetical protein